MCAMALPVLSDAIVDGSGKVAVVQSSAEALSSGTSIEAPALLGASTAARSVARATFVGPNSGRDGHHNAMLKSGTLAPAEGQTSVWRFHIVEGSSVKMGMSREVLYKDGYGCRSLGINSVGNLASNSLLSGHYMRHLQAGDTLDLFMERSGTQLTIYFSLNNEAHGSKVVLDFAGEQPSAAAALDSVVPIIGFGEQDRAAVVFVEFEPVPTQATAPYKATPHPATGPAGSWKTEQPHPMQLTVSEGELKVTAKVRNSFITNARLQPNHSISAPGNIITTRMLGPPFEREVGQWLAALAEKQWNVSADGTTLTIGDVTFTRESPNKALTYAGAENPLHAE